MGKDEVGWLYAVQTSNAIPVLRAYLEDPSNTDLHREVTLSMIDQLEISWFNAAMYNPSQTLCTWRSRQFERRLWRLEDRRRFRNAYPGFATVLQQQGDGVMDILENG